MRIKALSSIGVLALWAVLQFTLARPVAIADDWLGWRQADTQTIARNFMNRGIDVLHPQINWGGDGPGYVETELQVYPALVALAMKFTGEAEWPGQVISLLCIALTGLVLASVLAGRYGTAAGMLGLAAFLTGQGPVHLSTSVQPDAFSLLWFTLGLAAFLRYVENEDGVALVVAAACTSAAALIKPTALCLGATQFLLVLLQKPKLLRQARLWLAWAAVLAIVGVYLRYSYGLYVEFGNTFGVLGGDSKFPSLRSFFQPVVYLKLAYMILAWGPGIFGVAAGLYLALRRKVQAAEIALLVGYVFGLLIALRYATNRGYGPHYHMFGAVLGAWFVAHAVHALLEPGQRNFSPRLVVGVLAVAILVQYGVNLYGRNHPSPFHIQRDVTTLGRELARVARPGELVVVKSVARSVAEDLWGNRANNYEDPRVFYLADVRGWVVPVETDNQAAIERYAARGAKYYVEPGKEGKHRNLYAWLSGHAELLFNAEAGRIYAFR